MKTPYTLLFLLSFACLKAQQKLPKDKQTLVKSVQRHEAKLIEISDKIWAHAEIAFKETKSSKLLADYAEANGFTVTRGVAGMPTAFVATYGSGKPVI
ncbi:MAG: amidohydrolase, partial [Marinirhabdus sp.]